MKIKMAIIHNRSKEIKQLGDHEKESLINRGGYIDLFIYLLIIHALIYPCGYQRS